MRGLFMWMPEDDDLSPKIAEANKKGYLCWHIFTMKSNSYDHAHPLTYFFDVIGRQQEGANSVRFLRFNRGCL
jgi:hypothetical protein